MTFSENCICGAEFYVNSFWAGAWNKDWIEKQYKRFLDAHKVCRENNNLQNSQKKGSKNDNK